MKNNLIINLREEILCMRKERGSRFLFLPKNSLKFFARIYLYEFFGKVKQADNLLLNFVLRDLIERKVLVKNMLIKSRYELGDFTYHDVMLKTFDNQYYCRGTSTDEMEAYAKALGEVFERYTLKHYADFVVEKSNFENDNLKGRVLNYEEYPQPTPEQLEKFAMFRIEKEDEFNFIKVKDIKSEKVNEKQDEKYVSIQAFSLNSQFLQDKKTIIYATTNGAGGGYSFEYAKNSALFEILHRHYFLTAWFQKKTFNKIVFDVQDMELIKTNLYKKYTSFLKRGFKIHFVNLSDEAKVPTIICILEKLGGWYCGASTAISLYAASERALDEALSAFVWVCGRNLRGIKNYDKNSLDTVKDGFVDEVATNTFKIHAFGNSYFMKSLDKFFIAGQEKKFNLPSLNKELSTEDKSKIENIIPGPVFEYIYKTELLNDYNYNVTKYYVPHTQYFPLDEIYMKPLVKGGKPPIFTRINPFP